MRPLLIPFLLISSVFAATGPVTIDQSNIYKGQRNCAFECFVAFNDIGYPIAKEISCATFPVKNECFCRTDLQLQANRYVSSCVNLYCSKNALDISTATKLYDDYCTSNGYVQAQATTTSATGAFTITVTEAATTVRETTTTTRTVVASSEARGGPPIAGASRWLVFTTLFMAAAGTAVGVVAFMGLH